MENSPNDHLYDAGEAAALYNAEAVALYDAGEAEREAEAQAQETEYSNAIVSFDDAAHAKDAALASVDDAFDDLINAARDNPFGQDVLREAADVLEVTEWQIKNEHFSLEIERRPLHLLAAMPNGAFVACVPADGDIHAAIAEEAKQRGFESRVANVKIYDGVILTDYELRHGHCVVDWSICGEIPGPDGKTYSFGWQVAA